MNPGPKIFHTSVYIHVLNFEFRSGGLLQAGCPMNYPVWFNRFSNRQAETAVLLVDALFRTAGVS